MITIVYERDEYCVTVTGHACAGARGEDIVCAGVSALTEAMLQRVKSRAKWQPAYGVNKSRATARVHLTPRSKRAEESAREMLETICAGYQAIAEQYPDHVRYEVR